MLTQIFYSRRIVMFNNFLQVSDNSLEVTKQSYDDKTNSTKDYRHNKYEIHAGEANTYCFHNDKQNSKEIKDSNGLENELEQTQILIAEAENELLVLFREYLSSLGLHTDTVDRGDEALDRFLNRKNKQKPYDVVVLDTHLHDSSGLDVAKRIRSEKPDQKIVLVTTTPKEILPTDCLKTAGIKEEDILTMPFRLSKLVSVLKN